MADHSTHFYHMVLTLLVPELPKLLVCLTALILILVRWKYAPGSSLWALLGFGFVFLLCIVTPLATANMIDTPLPHRARWVVTFALSKIVLEVAGYTFLLIAILSERSKSQDRLRLSAQVVP